MCRVSPNASKTSQNSLTTGLSGQRTWILKSPGKSRRSCVDTKTDKKEEHSVRKSLSGSGGLHINAHHSELRFDCQSRLSMPSPSCRGLYSWGLENYKAQKNPSMTDISCSSITSDKINGKCWNITLASVHPSRENILTQ